MPLRPCFPKKKQHCCSAKVRGSLLAGTCSQKKGRWLPITPWDGSSASYCTYEAHTVRGHIEFLGTAGTAPPYPCKDVTQHCLRCWDLHQQRKSVRKTDSEQKFQVVFSFTISCGSAVLVSVGATLPWWLTGAPPVPLREAWGEAPCPVPFVHSSQSAG